jgi:glycosidase
MRTNDAEGEKAWTVATQLHDPESVLNFFRKALKIRKQYDVLVRTIARILSMLLKGQSDIWRFYAALS